MENSQPQTVPYKRTSKHPSDDTKAKISSALKGRAKSDSMRSKLSASMKAYWSDPNNFPDDYNDDGGETSFADIILEME